MSPFDRAHIPTYSPFTETIICVYLVSFDYVANCLSNVANVSYIPRVLFDWFGRFGSSLLDLTKRT